MSEEKFDALDENIHGLMKKVVGTIAITKSIHCTTR